MTDRAAGLGAAPRRSALGRAAMALLVLLTLVAVAGGVVAWTQGYRLYAVRTGSMAPAYPTGTLVVVAPLAQEVPTTGSVITFRIGDGLVTHRVFATSAGGLTTRGDANPSPDAWTLPLDRVVGSVVAAVPNGGYILVFFKQPTGALTLVSGLVSLTLLWTLFFPGGEPAPGAERAPRPVHARA
ncbi:signal peptidase I [Pengzhenrongella sicca]|uniref:Signal peptidase I n=1 Tax=Pengzhenrongella sicca TaxID=2819238 RepID=A0A8A4ZFA7_9MICO|nr:signal peptidase I [Pengzhenrongella sicca]QTE29689.1 signal peptidase I [Pengzhenrongella sicca]